MIPFNSIPIWPMPLQGGRIKRVKNLEVKEHREEQIKCEVCIISQLILRFLK